MQKYDDYVGPFKISSTSGNKAIAVYVKGHKGALYLSFHSQSQIREKAPWLTPDLAARIQEEVDAVRAMKGLWE